MLRSVASPRPPTANADLPRSRVHLCGSDFEIVCVRRSGVAVYRGDNAYLRIGAVLEAEIAAHRLMLERGYPVARILSTGRHGGVPYMIETSLGRMTLGDRFSAEHEVDGRISEQGFGIYLTVAERYARAQAASVVDVAGPRALARLVGLEDAVVLVPDVADAVREAFIAAVPALERLPMALTHPDLHALNMCPGGVIDLEDVDWGPAGYDVVTAPFVQDLCGLVDRGTRWLSTSQVDAYLGMVDRVFGEEGLRIPSDLLNELLVCRSIALCATRHPVPALWAARQRVLRRVVRGFLDGEGVRSLLSNGG
jgi:Phosphotransferase enzyme family